MDQEYQIIVDVADSISFAAWQNSVPLVTEVRIKNESPDPISDLELKLTTSSGFLKTKTWKIERLLAGDELRLKDCQVSLDPGYLSGLNEAEKSQLTFKLFAKSELLASTDCNVRVLAREEWGGINQGGELVAAFVMPNDPAIAKILKSAAKILERCLLYTSPSPRDRQKSRMPSSA